MSQLRVWIYVYVRVFAVSIYLKNAATSCSRSWTFRLASATLFSWGSFSLWVLCFFQKYEGLLCSICLLARSGRVWSGRVVWLGSTDGGACAWSNVTREDSLSFASNRLGWLLVVYLFVYLSMELCIYVLGRMFSVNVNEKETYYCLDNERWRGRPDM